MRGAAGTLHLLGGGPGAIRTMRRHAKAIVESLGKRRPLIAYVGAASDDNAAFQKMIGGALFFPGARLEAAKLASRRAKPSLAWQLLQDCDLIFVSGGDVERGMEVLRERDMVDPLRRLIAGGKPTMGVSAGSIMLAREWVRFPGEDEGKAELFPCIAAAPVHVDTHAEAEDWDELRVLVRLLGRRDGDEPVGYGIPSAGCLRVEPIAGGARLTALGVEIPRIVSKNGRVVADGALLPGAE